MCASSAYSRLRSSTGIGPYVTARERVLIAVAKDTGARKLARTWGALSAEPRATMRPAVEYDQLPAEQSGVADDPHVVAVDRYGQGQSSRDILRLHQD